MAGRAKWLAQRAPARQAHGVVEIRRLSEPDWSLLRTVRLRALADAPEAFGSTHAEELRLSASDWRARLTSGAAQFLAVDGDEPVAIGVGLPGASADPDEWLLVSMWVAGSHRGRRIAQQLIRAVVSAARSAGAARVRLAVVQGNDSALRAYLRDGFVLDGSPYPMDRDASVLEQDMILELT